MSDQPELTEQAATAVAVREPAPAPIPDKPQRERSAAEWKQIERRKAASAVAAMSWAEKISQSTAYAVVVWCESRDIDPINELDVLGGKPAPNGKYWTRKIGEMIAAGLVEWYREDFINDDPRLAKIGTQDAIAESERRALARVRYNVPEEAAAIAVVSVKLRALTEPVVGWQWAGGGTGRKIGYQGAIKTGAEADPIGELFPSESALTRAWGKVGRIIAAKVHGIVTDVPDPSRIYAEATNLGKDMQAEQGKAKAEALESAKVGHRMLKPATGDQGYSPADVGAPGE